MSKCLQKRKLARQIVTIIIQQLRICPQAWHCRSLPHWMELHHDKVAIQISLRRLRVFDSVYLKVDDADVWLPVCQRLKLRKAVRHWCAEHAMEAMKVWRK